MKEILCFLPTSAGTAATKMAAAKTAKASATTKAATAATAKTARSWHENDMAVGAAAGICCAS